MGPRLCLDVYRRATCRYPQIRRRRAKADEADCRLAQPHVFSDQPWRALHAIQRGHAANIRGASASGASAADYPASGRAAVGAYRDADHCGSIALPCWNRRSLKMNTLYHTTAYKRHLQQSPALWKLVRESIMLAQIAGRTSNDQIRWIVPAASCKRNDMIDMVRTAIMWIDLFMAVVASALLSFQLIQNILGSVRTRGLQFARRAIRIFSACHHSSAFGSQVAPLCFKELLTIALSIFVFPCLTLFAFSSLFSLFPVCYVVLAIQLQIMLVVFVTVTLLGVFSLIVGSSPLLTAFLNMRFIMLFPTGSTP